MKRTLLKIAVLALTFALGVGVSVYWQLYQWSLVPYEVNPIPPWPLGPAKAAVPAKTDEITIVGGMDACGAEANYHTMTLSDGTQISQSCERLSRLALARELKSRLLNAEIAHRSADRDTQDILITSPRVMRLTINGNSLCVTEAPSLKHLQLYETGALR